MRAVDHRQVNASKLGLIWRDERRTKALLPSRHQGWISTLLPVALVSEEAARRVGAAAENSGGDDRRLRSYAPAFGEEVAASRFLGPDVTEAATAPRIVRDRRGFVQHRRSPDERPSNRWWSRQSWNRATASRSRTSSNRSVASRRSSFAGATAGREAVIAPPRVHRRRRSLAVCGERRSRRGVRAARRSGRQAHLDRHRSRRVTVSQFAGKLHMKIVELVVSLAGAGRLPSFCRSQHRRWPRRAHLSADPPISAMRPRACTA